MRVECEVIIGQTLPSDVPVCKYSELDSIMDLVCCSYKNLPIKTEYLLDSEICEKSFIDRAPALRDSSDLVKAIMDGSKEITEEDCENIQKSSQEFFDAAMNHEKIKTYCEDIEEHEGIFLGKTTQLGEFPNIAALGFMLDDGEISYKCGGSIISSRWIITAAHCKSSKYGPPVAVRVGDRFLKTSQDDEHAQQLTIEDIYHHFYYLKERTRFHDVALIKTREEIIFNEFVNHACITSKMTLTDIPLSVAGFGKTESDIDRERRNELLKVEIFEVDRGICTSAYKRINSTPEGISFGQICAKAYRNETSITPDSCQGDSGGPVQYFKEHSILDADYNTTLMKTTYKIPMLVGVVSFGAECGSDIPSVNTFVPHYINWIKSVVTNF